MLRVLACLVLALLLPVAVDAKPGYTSITVTNSTADPVAIESYIQNRGHVTHWGVFRPSAVTHIALKWPDQQYFTDIHVYAKKGSTAEPGVPCDVVKPFSNDNDGAPIAVHVYYDPGTRRCAVEAH